MTIRPVVRLTARQRNELTELLMRESVPIVMRRAERLGQRMVEHAQAIIARRFITDRPARRRKRGPHLINSLTYRIELGGRLPIQVALTTKPGVNAKKVAALNYGYGAHRIAASSQGWLVFPWARVAGARANNMRKFHAYSLPNFRARSVTSPAKVGAKFMEEARLEAVREL